MTVIENGPVEIADSPIKNGDLSIVFCMFTRGYLSVSSFVSHHFPRCS